MSHDHASKHSHATKHSHGHDLHLHTGLAALRGNPEGLTGVHRLDRRRFIAEVGRGTLALAILGPMAACSSSSSSESTGLSSESSTTAGVAGSDDGQNSDSTQSKDDVDDKTLQWSQVSLGFVSAYVLVRGNTAAVVDSGTPGSAAAIGEGLATFGVTYDDVAHVLLTHAHGDHIGGLPEILGQAPAAMTYAGASTHRWRLDQHQCSRYRDNGGQPRFHP